MIIRVVIIKNYSIDHNGRYYVTIMMEITMIMIMTLIRSPLLAPVLIIVFNI